MSAAKLSQAAAERAVSEAVNAAIEHVDEAATDFWQQRADREGRLADAYEALRMVFPLGRDAIRMALLDASTYRRSQQDRALQLAKEEGEVSR